MAMLGITSIALAAKPTEAEQVRAIIDRVNSYWQTNHSPCVWSFWDQAAYHTGNMEAYFLSGNERYRAYSEAWAEHNEWRGAKCNDKSKWRYETYGEGDEFVLFGDYQICFQTYVNTFFYFFSTFFCSVLNSLIYKDFQKLIRSKFNRSHKKIPKNLYLFFGRYFFHYFRYWME